MFHVIVFFSLCCLLAKGQSPTAEPNSAIRGSINPVSLLSPDRHTLGPYNNPYYNPSAATVPILSYSNNRGIDGSYSYSYSTGDGKQAQESGFLKDAFVDNTGAPQGTQVVEGSYSYISPEGIPIQVHYIADENGFRPSGVHIPADGKGFPPVGTLGVPPGSQGSHLGALGSPLNSLGLPFGHPLRAPGPLGPLGRPVGSAVSAGQVYDPRYNGINPFDYRRPYNAPYNYLRSLDGKHPYNNNLSTIAPYLPQVSTELPATEEGKKESV